MTKTRPAGALTHGIGDGDARAFRLLFAICFLVFLLCAAVARLVGWRWRPWPPGPNGYRSVIEEARREANTVVPFAFLS